MEIIGSIILSITQSILFYGKQIGISMIIFEIIFNIVMCYILQKKNKVQNKAGILLMIPILLLSSTFFIFANKTFYLANIVIIFVLNIIMYVIITNKKDYLTNYIYNAFEIVPDVASGYKEGIHYTNEKSKEHLDNNIKFSKGNLKKVAGSLIIVILVVGVVLALLASADMIFANLFSGLNKFLNNINGEFIYNSVLRIIIIIFLYFLFLAFIIALKKSHNREESYLEERQEKSTFTVKLLLIVLNIVYLVFCFIQVYSLFGKMNIDANFDYAVYARTGFFQLMFVSFINFAIILIATKCNNKKEGTVQFLSVLLIVFTIIIAISSMYRMYLYSAEYGLTYLRMFVYIILIAELITFIPAIAYIFNNKIDIMKCAVSIGIFSYCIANCMNLEYIIVNKNINRNNVRSIDYKYISDIASEDSYEIIYRKLKNGNLNEKDKLEILEILYEIASNTQDLSWQEFNISKHKILQRNVDIRELSSEIEKLQGSKTTIRSRWD